MYRAELFRESRKNCHLNNKNHVCSFSQGSLKYHRYFQELYQRAEAGTHFHFFFEVWNEILFYKEYSNFYVAV